MRLLGKLNDVPLSVKLFGILIAVVLAGIVVSYALTNQVATQEFAAFTRTQGRAQALTLRPLLADYYRENGSWSGIPDEFKEQRAQGNSESPSPMMGHHMMGQRGQMMMGPGMWSMTLRMQGLALVDSLGQVVVDPQGVQGERQLSDRLLEAAGTPIEVDGQRVGWLVPTAALSQFTPQQEAYLGSVRRAILIGGVVAAALAILLGGIFLGQVTTPLRRLRAAARHLAAGHLSQRVPVHSGDEVGGLAHTFNEMASRLQRSEALRRQMIQDVAHELRTPLTVIQGDLQALKDGIYDPTPETINSIHEESRLLSRLIDDLRELSLAEAGELRLEQRPTELSELLREGARTFVPRLEKRGIELVLELSQGPITADVDRDRLEQVLSNLLSNAVRYTPKGGRITLSLTSCSEPIEAVIGVADSGPGIPPEDLPYVFERFWRKDKARTRASGGTGLGLAIAKRLVEAHGGRMWVESEPGQGAMFAFALPQSSMDPPFNQRSRPRRGATDEA